MRVKDKIIGLRVAAELKTELEQLAAQADRSLSNYINQVLMEHTRGKPPRGVTSHPLSE